EIFSVVQDVLLLRAPLQRDAAIRSRIDTSWMRRCPRPGRERRAEHRREADRICASGSGSPAGGGNVRHGRRRKLAHRAVAVETRSPALLGGVLHKLYLGACSDEV